MAQRAMQPITSIFKSRIKWTLSAIIDCGICVTSCWGKIMTLCPGNPNVRTHWALRCSTCCLFLLAHHVRRSLVAYREIIAMSNYHWLSRSCIIRSAMPFSDVKILFSYNYFRMSKKVSTTEMAATRIAIWLMTQTPRHGVRKISPRTISLI